MARDRRHTRSIPRSPGETLGPGRECGHVPLGPEHTYWFATERTAEGGCAPHGELAHLKSEFGSWAEPLPAAPRRDRPRPRTAQRPVRPRPGAGLVEGSDRSGRRRRTPDAAASWPGRLPGTRRRRDPGQLRRSEQRSGDGVRPVRDVPQAAGAGRWCASRRGSVRYLNLRPACPERPRRSRDGAGARGGAHPASGHGGVAVGVQGADGGVSLGRTGSGTSSRPGAGRRCRGSRRRAWRRIPSSDSTRSTPRAHLRLNRIWATP